MMDVRGGLDIVGDIGDQFCLHPFILGGHSDPLPENRLPSG